jgi:hypothetical protein
MNKIGMVDGVVSSNTDAFAFGTQILITEFKQSLLIFT